MLTSSRDNWERLVAAVIRREELWQLFHDHSRSPSISTLSSSDSNRHLSRQVSSFADVSAPPVPQAKTSPSPVRNHNSGVTKRGGFAAGATIIFAAPRNLIAAIYRRRKVQHPTENEDLAEIYAEQVRRFSLSELEVATDKFSNKNLLRRNGYGEIYKGLLADGFLVEIQRLRASIDRRGWFQAVVEIRSLAVHKNVHYLLGFCMEKAELLLVYPFMSNGSVASWLREKSESKPLLYWPTRMRIATASARGLAYLHEHCDPKIIHREFQASNILLDDDFEAAVSNFALAKFMDPNDVDVQTIVRGTFGHLAPEYISTGRCSEKSDVFSYGVFLLELITAQRAYVLARLADDDDLMLLDWVKGLVMEKKCERLVDTHLQGNYVQVEMEQLLQIALVCTHSSPLERPKMSEIVRMLETNFDGVAERFEEYWVQEENLRRYRVTNDSWIMEKDEWDEEMLRQDFETWWEERQAEDMVRQNSSNSIM